jgi:methanogenic corrinoid protein MtbC1
MVDKQQLLDQLAQAVVDMDVEAVEAKSKEAIEAGIPAFEAITVGLSAGMKRVGEMWGRMEIFMPEVMGSVDTYYAGMKLLKPQIKASEKAEYEATIVMGTIWGDIHSVGKDVATPVFEGENFRVIDLGLDVPVEKYVEAVKEYRPEFVGLGTYMSETFLHVTDLVEEFKQKGIRDDVIIVCGGPAVDSEFAKKMGADDAWNDAWEAIAGMKQLLKQKRG